MSDAALLCFASSVHAAIQCFTHVLMFGVCVCVGVQPAFWAAVKQATALHNAIPEEHAEAREKVYDLIKGVCACMQTASDLSEVRLL